MDSVFRPPEGPPHPLPPAYRPAWIDLEGLFGLGQGARGGRRAPDGLRVDGPAEGFVHSWYRVDGTGVWLGVVSYEVPWADGRDRPLRVGQHLLPAHLLRPRPTDR